MNLTLLLLDLLLFQGGGLLLFLKPLLFGEQLTLFFSLGLLSTSLRFSLSSHLRLELRLLLLLRGDTLLLCELGRLGCLLTLLALELLLLEELLLDERLLSLGQLSLTSLLCFLLFAGCLLFLLLLDQRLLPVPLSLLFSELLGFLFFFLVLSLLGSCLLSRSNASLLLLLLAVLFFLLLPLELSRSLLLLLALFLDGSESLLLGLLGLFSCLLLSSSRLLSGSLLL